MKRHIIRGILLIIPLIIVCMPPVTSTADYYERTYYPTDDTYLSQRQLDENFGTEEELQIRTNYGGGSSDWGLDLLIKFDLTSLPSGVYITKALLYLYYHSYIDEDPYNRSLNLTRLTSAWSETNVTWNNRPRNAGRTTNTSTVPAEFDWMTWDVSQDIQGYIDNQWVNYGWQIVDENTWGDIDIPLIVFYAKEHSNNSPYLEIEYSYEKPNEPPIADAGGPYFGYPNYSLQVNGSASTDTDGNITGYRWDFTNDSIWDTSWLSAPTASYTFNQTGNYTITLQVKDNENATASNTTIVNISIPENYPPQANFTYTPRYPDRSELISFNDTSTDVDGNITHWWWNFGDGHFSDLQHPTHLYDTYRLYNVTLMVTDNNGSTGNYSTAMNVTPNRPPTSPLIHGTTNGTTMTAYNYTFLSVDLNDDNISYIIDWDDNTSTNSSFLPNGTLFYTLHTWTKADIYTISCSVVDEQNITSEPQTYRVLIDALYVQEIGYLLDNDSDGIYDEFISNTTGNSSSVEYHSNGTYYIDDNGDGIWDYRYDPLTDTLTPLHDPEEQNNTPISIWWLLITGGILLLIMCALYMIIELRKKITLTRALQNAEHHLHEVDHFLSECKDRYTTK